MESLVDPSVQSAAMSGMSVEAAAASQTRVRRWDQHAADSSAMWTIALTSPTIMSAEAIGMLNRTRVNPVVGNPIMSPPS